MQTDVKTTSAPLPRTTSAAKEEPKAFGPYKPLSKGPAGGLTAQQEKHITGLIERYTKKTAESKRLTQKYRKVMADPRVVSGFRSQWKEIVYPLTTVRSEGSKLYDVDGNEYIDILNGYGPTVFGHKPKFVTEAVQKQMELGFEIGPMSPLAGQVAELISEFTGMQRVAFTNTGSEAVLCAIRVARTATGRNKVVMFTGDYHGMFDEVLIRSIKRPGAALRSTPIAPGIPPQAAENIIVLDYGSAETLE
jgi:glutamate-1-semialdehyde aminotransferase